MAARWSIALTLGGLVAAVLLATPCAAQVSSSSSASSQHVAPGGPDLKTTLEKGLKARRKLEFDYIAYVVDLVNQGSLPIAMVEKTFLWARQGHRYPFPYFQKGLEVQAKKAGIKI